MGYDYEFGSSKALKWMWQNFNSKMNKYLGNKEFAKKQSRMDRVRLREEINFKLEVNPLVKIFSKINKKVEAILLM